MMKKQDVTKILIDNVEEVTLGQLEEMLMPAGISAVIQVATAGSKAEAFAAIATMEAVSAYIDFRKALVVMSEANHKLMEQMKD